MPGVHCKHSKDDNAAFILYDILDHFPILFYLLLILWSVSYGIYHLEFPDLYFYLGFSKRLESGRNERVRFMSLFLSFLGHCLAVDEFLYWGPQLLIVGPHLQSELPYKVLLITPWPPAFPCRPNGGSYSPPLLTPGWFNTTLRLPNPIRIFVFSLFIKFYSHLFWLCIYFSAGIWIDIVTGTRNWPGKTEPENKNLGLVWSYIWWVHVYLS